MYVCNIYFLEVAIESWPEWDLNPRPLNSVQMLRANFVQLLQFHLFVQCYIDLDLHLYIYIYNYIYLYIYTNYIYIH